MGTTELQAPPPEQFMSGEGPKEGAPPPAQGVAIGIPAVIPPPPQDPYAQTGSAVGQWLLRRPASSDSRLILDFFPEACCGDAIVIMEDVAEGVPPALAARGIGHEEWVEWMGRLKETVRKGNLSVTTCITLCLLGIPIPCVWYALVAQQRRMEAFAAEINAALFEPRGMFFKTQSSSISIQTGENSQYEENVYWIAISLNPEDAKLLRADEHLFSGFGPRHWSIACCNDAYKILCCCGQEPQY